MGAARDPRCSLRGGRDRAGIAARTYRETHQRIGDHCRGSQAEAGLVRGDLGTARSAHAAAECRSRWDTRVTDDPRVKKLKEKMDHEYDPKTLGELIDELMKLIDEIEDDSGNVRSA